MEQANWLIIPIAAFIPLILGFIWFKHECDDIRKRKKRGENNIWGSKPNIFLGIFIVIAFGISMIIRSI